MNASQALERIVGQASRGELVFPTNMAAALRLQQALGDPGCHLEKAAELVLAEPLIAARLVAIANSVAYTRFGGHVHNVRTAVSLLGFQPLRSLVAVIVIRQLASEITDPDLRHKADMLWQHCAHVAALAKIIAREFTSVDPETALFAGIVHEIGGFYLLSRATEFPVLLEEVPVSSCRDVHAALSRCMLDTLKIPNLVASAVDALFSVTSRMPPASTGEVLLLANALAPVHSPLVNWTAVTYVPPGELDVPLGAKTLRGVLQDCAEETKALTAALLI